MGIELEQCQYIPIYGWSGDNIKRYRRYGIYGKKTNGVWKER